MTNYTELQKRCQRGCVALSNANNLLAECHAAIGQLTALLECAQGDLRQAMKIIESSGAIEAVEPEAEVSTIDWIKAPADAEAGNPESSQILACWYKRNQWGEVMVIVDGTDIDWLHMGGRKDFPFGAQLRPASE